VVVVIVAAVIEEVAVEMKKVKMLELEV
jgi:hypothetical protein